MSETPEEKAAREAAETAAAAAAHTEPKPPWGSPEEFSPEKAWALITKLREQKNDPAAAREIKDLRDKVEAFENEKRTEVEKAQARADAAEKALSESVSASLRQTIALEKGLTASQAKRLVGTTRDELEADATALLAEFPHAVVPKAPGAESLGNSGAPLGTAKEQITQAELTKLYAEKKYADIETARLDGRLDSLLGA